MSYSSIRRLIQKMSMIVKDHPTAITIITLCLAATVISLLFQKPLKAEYSKFELPYTVQEMDKRLDDLEQRLDKLEEMNEG